jgi:hypothetical protein
VASFDGQLLQKRKGKLLRLAALAKGDASVLPRAKANAKKTGANQEHSVRGWLLAFTQCPSANLGVIRYQDGGGGELHLPVEGGLAMYLPAQASTTSMNWRLTVSSIPMWVTPLNFPPYDGSSTWM